MALTGIPGGGHFYVSSFHRRKKEVRHLRRVQKQSKRRHVSTSERWNLEGGWRVQLSDLVAPHL